MNKFFTLIRRYCFVGLPMCLTATAFAQSGQTSWVGRMGGASAEEMTYNSVATDNAGNVYLTGKYSDGLPAGSATFSTHNTATFTAGGFSNATLPFTHAYNTFVYKANAAGNIQWVKQIAGNSAGGYNTVMINAIDADAAGNLYITGSYRADVDLNPGAAVVTPTVGSSAADNMFILKLNTSGDYIWHREFRDVANTGTGRAAGRAIKVSGTSLYSAIQFTTGKGLYTPSSATPVANSSLTATGTGNNTAILKLDTAGNFVWVKPFATTGTNASTAFDIDVDAAGNIYTAGSFTGTGTNQIDFDPAHTSPSGTTAYASAGSSDIFLSKLNTAGNFVWSKVIGNTGLDDCYTLALSNTSVYIAGSISSPTVDFNPGGTPTGTLTNMGNSDVFVSAFAMDGTFQWANKYGGGALDLASGITCLPNGDLYIAGRVSRSGVPLDFDPQTTGNQSVTNFATASTNNNTEAFLLKLNATGAFQWVYTMGVSGAGNTNDYAYGVASHESAGSRSVYTAGTTGSLGASTIDNNQAQFPVNLSDLSTTPVIRIAGTGTTGSTGGGVDIFLHKALEIQTPCTPTASTVTTTACGSYTIGTNTYTQSGVYTATLTNAAGCDSVVTLNLTINPVSNSSFTQTACDSFAFGGQTYYQSGNYTHTFTSINGCDSTVTVFLAVGASSTATLTETACGSFTLGSQTYTQSGTYTQTIPNNVGCDSTITLNLTINTVNAGATQNNNTLTAQTSGATYQWINCANNTPVSGATQQSFTATQNGSYAVIVTLNNCSDTSACFTINEVGIKDRQKQQDVAKVFPNPANNVLQIESGIKGYISLNTVDGRTILFTTIEKGNSIINISELASGLYFVKILDTNRKLMQVIKVTKE